MARPTLPSYNDPGASPSNPEGGWVGVIKAAINDVSDRIDAAVTSVTNLASTVAQKAADSAVVKLTGDQSIAGNKTFTGSVTVPAPTADGHAVTRAYYTANLPAAGGGGTAGVTTDATSTSSTLAPSAATTRNMIGSQGPVIKVNSPKYLAAATNGYTSIQMPTDADSATTVANKLASNLAVVNAAIADANGALVDGGPDPIALNGSLSYPSGNLKLNLLHWRGSNAQARGIRPALRILNLFDSAMVMDIGSLQVGPTNPVANITTFYGGSMGQLVAPGGTGQDNQGGYRLIKTTDVGVVYCKDKMVANGETGLVSGANLTNVNVGTFRAEQIGVHGIGLNVSSVNLTTAGTAIGGYPYTSLERHLIVGESSGVQAYANSWAVDQAAGTTGKLIFGSVPGDFRNGENLRDGSSTGPVIGVAGQMFVAFAGELLWDYNMSVRMAVANATTPGTWTAQDIADFRPRFRLMNKAQVSLDITVKASHDVDTFLTTDERNIAAIEVNGAYAPTIKIKALSGYSRLLLIRSCEAPDIQVDAVGIANHAIGLASPNAEEAYGYGVELQGTTRYARVHDCKGRFLRHLFTTNPNSRTWGTTSADGIPDYMGMGSGSMWAEVRDSVATECFSAPFDTHELAWGTKWRNLDVFRSYSGSRAVTTPAGYNSRGFADDYQDCRVDGTVGGFSNGGVALSSGIAYRTVYRGVSASNVQTSGMSFSPFKSGLGQDQSGLLASQQAATFQYARVAFYDVDVQMDNSIPRGSGLQYGIVCDVGTFDWYGSNRSGGANDSPLRIRAGGVHVFHDGFEPDWTTCSFAGAIGIRLDGASNVTMLEPIKAKTKSATIPASAIVNVSGNSLIAHKGVDWVSGADTATVQTRPTQPFSTTTAGTPTIAVLTPVTV